MTEIPAVWLWVSGIFFALNIVFLIGLTVIVIMLAKLFGAMQPKLVALETSAQSLVEKVNAIAGNVEELTATVKATAAEVGGNARSVATNAQIVSQTAAREFERYSPVLMGIVTAVKVVRAIGELRAKPSQAEPGKKPKSKLGLILNIASHFLGR